MQLMNESDGQERSRLRCPTGSGRHNTPQARRITKAAVMATPVIHITRRRRAGSSRMTSPNP